MFLIYTGAGSYLMIPKRGFESKEELEAMRSLLKLMHTAGMRVSGGAGYGGADCLGRLTDGLAVASL